MDSLSEPSLSESFTKRENYEYTDTYCSFSTYTLCEALSKREVLLCIFSLFMFFILSFCIFDYYYEYYYFKHNYKPRWIAIYDKEFNTYIPMDMIVLKKTLSRWCRSELERGVPNREERDALYIERKRILESPSFTDKTMCDICKTRKGAILRQCMDVLCKQCILIKSKRMGKIDIDYLGYINYKKNIYAVPIHTFWH